MNQNIFEKVSNYFWYLLRSNLSTIFIRILYCLYSQNEVNISSIMYVDFWQKNKSKFDSQKQKLDNHTDIDKYFNTGHLLGSKCSFIVWFSSSEFNIWHRLENRCVLRHISVMNFQSLAVLGSRGCREKNSNRNKHATFEASFFLCLCGQKKINFFENTLASGYMI